jgi:hypothetical protein
MTMSDEAADALRAAGINVTDDEMTAARAVMDQATAAADHLIDHGLTIARSKGNDAVVIDEGMQIRGHIYEHGPMPESAMALITALVTRSGQLADIVMKDADEKTRLRTALAAAQGGQL